MIGKRFLPKSLFGRAVLILVLPTLLTQSLMAYIFFDRHWTNVTRYLSGAMAGEIGFFIDQIERVSPSRRDAIEASFERTTGMRITFDSRERFSKAQTTDEFPEFQETLDRQLEEPFTVRRVGDGGTIQIRVQLAAETLIINASAKRLESRTTVIYILWMMGVSAIFLLIAILFLRNQVRPIRRLAEAADGFGRGAEVPNFRPHGAAEVRKAGIAFIVMRERIKRQLRTRTEMLAGISHDLRTPLTRMKLQLAMLGDKEAGRELGDDVQQMEHMIQEYLDFARGEGGEEAVRIWVGELLADIAADYARMHITVGLEASEDMAADVRPSSFRRMLHNVIDNAVRYGKTCRMTLRRQGSYCEIVIDDDGPGIPADKRDEVFKPFSRLDSSRNSKTGGVGLGLAIARDIARAHGGGITLDDAPGGGLRVILRLPLEN